MAEIVDHARRLDHRRAIRNGVVYGGTAAVLYGALSLIWPAPLGVVAQGVIIGALTSLISFGLALIYRSSRVINFAQADLGAIPAVAAILLLTRTRVAEGVQVEASWPYLVVLPVALAAAVLIGWVVNWVFVRRFRDAPRLILMVVTIGVSQILVGMSTLLPLWSWLAGDNASFLSVVRRYPPPFHFEVTISPVVFNANDLIAVVTVIVSMTALYLFLRHTGIGVAVRASAESSERAGLLGINVGLTQSVVWIVATVLSTLALFLRGGILGLPLGSALGPSILLRALAAAVIGRMVSYPAMFAAACGLGIVEAAVLWNEPSPALVDPALAVVVVGALLVQRRRGSKESRVEDQATSSWQDVGKVRAIPRELAGLPAVRRVFLAASIAAAAVLLALPLVLTIRYTNLVAAVFIYGVVAASLVILVGWAGEITLGQMAFVGIGAAVGGALIAHHRVDLTLALLAAGAVGAVASVIVGLPALRIRGPFLAVTTLAFALATSSFLLDRDYFGYLPDNVTTRVERLPILGLRDVSSENAFYYVCLSVLGLAIWMIGGLRRSRVARVLVASRENVRAFQAFGLNVTTARLLAFATSGFFAAMAGGLLAAHQRSVGEALYAPVESIRALTMVVVGGPGSVAGGLLGAAFLKSTEWLNVLVPQDYRFFFTFVGSGAGLIFVLLFLPDGLGSLLYRGRDAFLRLVATRRGIVVPSLFADADAARAAATKAAGAAAEDAVVTASPAAPAFLRRGRRAAPSIDYLSYPDLVLGGGQTSLLSVRSLDVSYGQVQVLFGVNLEVDAGEIVALLGTNGAGKSTVLRAITGLARPGRGYVTLEGAELSGMPPHRVAALGVALVPGGRGVFPSLSVAENLQLGAWLFRRDKTRVDEAVSEVLDLFPVLADKRGVPAATLSGGQQQMLTLGMAFMSRPRLLMVDELSLGLAPAVVEQLLEIVRRIRAQGTTVILVEQSVNLALTVAERAFFMEKGEVRFHGPTAELLERPDVLRAVFLEGAASRTAPPRGPARAAARDVSSNGHAADAQVVLEVRAVSKSFAGVKAVKEASLRLHDGEILGLMGPNGAGKTTIFDLISGYLEPDEGSIVLLGRDVTSVGPARRSRFGLARSFQDARLFGGLTVHQNIAVALDRFLDVRDPIGAGLSLPAVRAAELRLAARADDLIERLGLQAFRDKFVSELSTGSRRIVDLACQLGTEPRVILFDEPSSGIAQRETESLGPLLRSIRDQTGASLVVIEHDMPLLTSISDSVVALDLGAVVLEGDAGTVLNDPRVVASYLGSDRAVIERSGAVAQLVEAGAP